ncbi:hypothetical protein PFISCL1PPCAC_25302, partial [Pristionchus fissidentatus]
TFVSECGIIYNQQQELREFNEIFITECSEDNNLESTFPIEVPAEKISSILTNYLPQPIWKHMIRTYHRKRWNEPDISNRLIFVIDANRIDKDISLINEYEALFKSYVVGIVVYSDCIQYICYFSECE